MNQYNGGNLMMVVWSGMHRLFPPICAIKLVKGLSSFRLCETTVVEVVFKN